MARIRKTDHGWRLFCPGCNEMHAVDGRWAFSGTYDRPTLSPSLSVSTEERKVMTENGACTIPALKCHSFVRDGRMEFLTDSTHALAGKTVDLPELDG